MKAKKISLKARKALAEGNIREATSLLGNYYTLQGTVVKGREVGRSLGFPTANLKLNDFSPLFLASGVYAVKIKHDNNIYDGMVNIGIRPTFEQHELTIEVNLFDFSENIYGHELVLYFVERIRDEMKFQDIDSLIRQISIDKKNITELLSGSNKTDTNTF